MSGIPICDIDPRLVPELDYFWKCFCMVLTGCRPFTIVSIGEDQTSSDRTFFQIMQVYEEHILLPTIPL